MGQQANLNLITIICDCKYIKHFNNAIIFINNFCLNIYLWPQLF